MDYSNMIGRRFGKWTVLKAELRQTPRQRHVYFLCCCECGVEKWIYRPNVIKGLSTQCKACACRGQGEAMKAAVHRRSVLAQSSKGKTVLGWKDGHAVVACKCGAAIHPNNKRCMACTRKYGYGPWPESLQAAADRYGVSRERIRQVAVKLGWDAMLVYFGSPRTYGGTRNQKYPRSVIEVAKELGISPKSMYPRINRLGWDLAVSKPRYSHAKPSQKRYQPRFLSALSCGGD